MCGMAQEILLALIELLPIAILGGESKPKIKSPPSKSSKSPQESHPTPLEEASSNGLFDEAVEYLRANPIKMSQQQQLLIYGLFKVATVGPCDLSKPPSAWDFVGKAKWESWKTQSHLSVEGARSHYVKTLFELKPNWREKTLNDLLNHHDPHSHERDEYGLLPEEREEEEEEEERSDKKPMGPVFSVPSRSFDDGDNEDIFAWCREGNLEKLQHHLKEEELDLLDEIGEGLLHLAVDQNHVHIVKYLLQRGANVNLLNQAKQSPIFLAVICEHEELVTILKEAGADLTIIDEDDSTVFDHSTEKLKKILED